MEDTYRMIDRDMDYDVLAECRELGLVDENGVTA
jgi:hypothetical protein